MVISSGDRIHVLNSSVFFLPDYYGNRGCPIKDDIDMFGAVDRHVYVNALMANPGKEKLWKQSK